MRFFAVIGAVLKIVPTWCYWILTLAALCVGCELHGRHVVQVRWRAETEARNERTSETRGGQEVVAVKTEIIYRDRIQKIYIKGDTVEKQVPIFVTAVDSRRCTVNAGVVRSYDAAWSGEPAGAAAESDRESAAVSLTEVAETDAFNARACLVWREIALGLREHYAQQGIMLEDR